MTRFIYCTKLKKEAAGLNEPPFPNDLGNRIYEHISAEAWQTWLNHQTMLINEYRLSMIEMRSRKFLLEELEKFLFGEGSDKPAGFTPKDVS